MSDLEDLGRRIASNGPVKTLPISRRIRIQHGGRYVADTTSALLVWEHEYFPQYYVPWDSFAEGSLSIGSGKSCGVQLLDLRGGAGKKTDRVIGFGELVTAGKAAELKGYVRVEFAAVDGWFEEDTPVFVHPKDPFKRVDIVHSSRPIRILIDDHPVASATSSLHLYETSLPTRYYLPPTSVDPALLRPSNTLSKCPYKGEANYYSVALPGGEVKKDVIWYYRNPILESGKLADQICFYNEKVDIELDGVRLERPKTKFG